MTSASDLSILISVIPLSADVIRRTPAAIRNDKSRAVWYFLLALDLAMAVRLTAVSDLLADATGVPDATALIKVLTGFGGVALLLQWVSTVVPGRMDGQREPGYRRAISNRPRRIMTAVLIVVSTALFPLSIRGEETLPQEFIFMQAGHLWGSLHLILFYLYMTFGTICAAMMFGAASRDPKAMGIFKHGMQVMITGCVCGALYAILRTGYLVTRLFDKPFLGGEVFVDVASTFAITGFALLILAGSSVPVWERMTACMHMHAAVNDLRPMWITLTSAVPSVVCRSRSEQWATRVLSLGVPYLSKELVRAQRAIADFWNWRGLEHRLNRRVTEICDASIRLQPYLPSGLPEESAETARELGAPDHAAPAYLLHAAMRLKETGSQLRSEVLGPILAPVDDPLVTTAMFLPIGKAMTNEALMSKFNRRIEETI